MGRTRTRGGAVPRTKPASPVDVRQPLSDLPDSGYVFRTGWKLATSDIDRRLLGIYLNDHLAGATAGAALARRARSAVRSAGMAAVLDELAPQIADDRATLIAIMRRLGVPVRQYKIAAGMVGVGVVLWLVTWAGRRGRKPADPVVSE